MMSFSQIRNNRAIVAVSWSMLSLVFSGTACKPRSTVIDETHANTTVAEDSVDSASDEVVTELIIEIDEESEPLPTEITLGAPELTAGIPGSGPLSVAEIKAWLARKGVHAALAISLPSPGLSAGESQIRGLEDNPLTRAKIELGRQLYFDPRLSADSSISCASCHHPDEGYARKTQFGLGIGDQTGDRNSPVSFNRIFSDAQFWDGRASSLEEQAKGPIENPIEMGNNHDACVECIKNIEGYRIQFAAAFPVTDIDSVVTIDKIARAIASFERAIVTLPAPADYFELVRTIDSQFEEDEIDELKEDQPELYTRYIEAVEKSKPMSESARRGRELFFGAKAGCTECHVGANFTDEKYHNLGVGMDAAMPDLGRFNVTQDEQDRGAFKTPTVRNAALTAPYMHDGSQNTLKEVVEWYAKGGHPNPHLSEKIKKLDLTDQDKADLVNYMKEGLTSPFPPVEMSRLPE